jgi:hypothetical protein
VVDQKNNSAAGLRPFWEWLNVSGRDVLRA